MPGAEGAIRTLMELLPTDFKSQIAHFTKSYQTQ
jgi:hypothetical protein